MLVWGGLACFLKEGVCVLSLHLCIGILSGQPHGSFLIAHQNVLQLVRGNALLQGLGKVNAITLLTQSISPVAGIFSALPSSASLLPSTR